MKYLLKDTHIDNKLIHSMVSVEKMHYDEQIEKINTLYDDNFELNDFANKTLVLQRDKLQSLFSYNLLKKEGFQDHEILILHYLKN